MRSGRALKPVAFALCLAPLAKVGLDGAAGTLGAEPVQVVLNRLGFWTLVVTIARGIGVSGGGSPCVWQQPLVSSHAERLDHAQALGMLELLLLALLRLHLLAELDGQTLERLMQQMKSESDMKLQQGLSVSTWPGAQPIPLVATPAPAQTSAPATPPAAPATTPNK